jgi:DNA-binding response OmpR family regulator
LILPKIDGDKLCRIIRRMDHLNKCLLVVISSVVAEMGRDFADIGADSYIAKGLDTYRQESRGLFAPLHYFF